jgi:hypothetical protein
MQKQTTGGPVVPARPSGSLREGVHHPSDIQSLVGTFANEGREGRAFGEVRPFGEPGFDWNDSLTLV